MSVIQNPSFETSGSGISEAANWTYTETAGFNQGSSYSKRGDWSTELSGTGMSQTGSFSYLLGASEYDPSKSVAVTANTSYCRITQSINASRIKTLTFDGIWKDTITPQPDGPRFSFDVLFGLTSIYSMDDDDAQSENEAVDEEIDFSSYAGTSSLSFQLRALKTGTFPVPSIILDNLREVLLPSQPTLITPTDEDDDVNLPVTFDWSDSEDVVTYVLQVATDDAFSNIVLSSTGITESTLTEAGTLLVGTTYYWRVYGVNANGNGEASATSSFTTFNAVAPTLDTPADNSTGQRLTGTTFEWTAGTDEDTDYDIQVATDSAFSNKIIDVSLGSNDTSYTTTEVLSKGTLYYWRVRATARSLVSDWSSTSQFMAARGRKCIVIAYTPELEAKDGIGVRMDDGVMHWTRINSITHTENVESVICLAEEPYGNITIGNDVLLPSVNNNRWTDDD